MRYDALNFSVLSQMCFGFELLAPFTDSSHRWRGRVNMNAVLGGSDLEFESCDSWYVHILGKIISRQFYWPSALLSQALQSSRICRKITLRLILLCTNQQPPQRGGAVPSPVWVGSKWLLAFPRVPVIPGTPQSFFRRAAPWTTAEGQHTASLKSVACSHFLFSPALILPSFVSSFFFFSWWAVTFILTLAPSFLALCALEMWPGGASQCNAAPAPNGSI